MKISAAVVHALAQPFVIEELDLETPRADEVLVRIVSTGICHNDLNNRDRGRGPLPVVLGHEGAGVVDRVGEHVTKVKPGDHVVLSVQSCGACRSCQRGLPTYCANAYPLNFGRARSDGSTALRGPDGPVHGHFFGQSSFATYALATERNVVKVPVEAPLEYLGPLGCGIMTGAGAVLNALHPSIGSRIAVFGAGAVGLSAIMAARLAGCTTIVAVDPQSSRRTLASELGATHALDPGIVNIVEAIRDLTGGGADYTLDTTGSSSATLVRQAVEALTTPGVCGLIAGAPPGTELTLDRSSLLWGRAIRGIIMGDATPDVFIPALIELHSQGRFPFDRLLGFFPFDEINEAAAAAEQGQVVKPVLQM